jgi:hypothetical protein
LTTESTSCGGATEGLGVAKESFTWRLFKLRSSPMVSSIEKKELVAEDSDGEDECKA